MPQARIKVPRLTMLPQAKADGDGTGINEDADYPEGHPAAAALGEYPADGIIGTHAQLGAHVEGAGKQVSTTSLA